MRKIAIAALLAASFTLGGCYSGPHQLQRTVDDWDQKVYVDSPWLNAVLMIIPVIPLARFGAAIGDFFITDAYAFWLNDAFGGKFPITWSLGIIGSLIAGSILLSFLMPKRSAA